MPAVRARSASSAPARRAWSIGARSRRVGSVQLTAAIVRPASSSISCAKMPRLERNTEIRGRSAVPWTFARTRRRRLRRRAGAVVTVTPCLLPVGALDTDRRHPAAARRSASLLSCSFTNLPGDVLALVADALALVGLRLALLADEGGDLSDLLLGGTLDHDSGRHRDFELDPLGCLDRHGMRVAERQLQIAAAELGAVAHALNLEALLESGRDARDHVRHQRAGQPVQGTMLTAIGRAGHLQLVADMLDRDVAVDALRELALGPVDDHALRLDRDRDAGRQGNWLSSDSGHELEDCLPDLRHDLAADAHDAGLVAGHDSLGGRDDRGAHPALDPGDVSVVDIRALARARYALHPGDHRLAVLGVLERHCDPLSGLLDRGRLQLVALDVALLLEDPGQLALELRGRDRDVLVLRLGCVAQARQEIGDGVGHRHEGATSSTWSFRGRIRCARARAGRSGTRRICGTRLWRDRNGGSGCSPWSCTWASASGGRAVRSWPCAPWFLSWCRGRLRAAFLRERHAERLEQRERLLVAGCRGGDRDVQAADLVDLVVVDLGEDDLLAHAHRVVAAAVERARVEPAEVADPRDRDR